MFPERAARPEQSNPDHHRRRPAARKRATGRTRDGMYPALGGVARLGGRAKTRCPPKRRQRATRTATRAKRLRLPKPSVGSTVVRNSPFDSTSAPGYQLRQRGAIAKSSKPPLKSRFTADGIPGDNSVRVGRAGKNVHKVEPPSASSHIPTGLIVGDASSDRIIRTAPPPRSTCSRGFSAARGYA